MSLIKIQDVIFPKQDVCEDCDLYYRKIGIPTSNISENGIYMFKKNQRVSFDTYFNSFSLLKWTTYTYVDNVSLGITLQGKFRITLLHYYLELGGVINYQKIQTEIFESATPKEFFLDYVTENPFGCLAFSVESLENNSIFYKAAYYSEIDKSLLSSVKLGIGICTFKREPYVKSNVNRLLNDIILNEQSEMRDRLEVFISDNASTLEDFANDHVHLVSNKNTGGSGGFTRCMIEAIRYNEKNDDKLTNLILMDDDVKFDVTSILRTYKILTLVRPEYKEAFIGGAMFKINQQNIQHASGEFWHGERCESFVETYNGNRNMHELINILENENFTNANYQAWWFCAIPMKMITYDNLSLPFFIKSDDIEFSIRNMKKLILLNGINVWHESFESKYSAQNEYYTVRNYLVSASAHNAPITKERVLEFFTNYIKHYIKNYKYLEIEHFCNAINDYLGGVEHLKSIDIAEYHKSILAKGYKMVDVSTLPIKFSDDRYYHDVSYDPKWSRIKRFFAKYTINGLLLPSNGFAVLGMWGGTTQQTFRKKFLVRYEITTKKGFILKRSLSKALKMTMLFLKTRRNLKKNFDRAYMDFATNWKSLPTLETWGAQLDLDTKQY